MRILIAGGSGLIGNALSKAFRSEGHDVFILSRSHRQVPNYIRWSVQEKTIQSDFDFDVVINLTGAGIVDRAWTSSYRQEIIKSRTESIKTLDKYFSSRQNKPDIYINASAIGIYGHHADFKFRESDLAKSDDFMVDVCRQWEDAVDRMTTRFKHTYIARIGVVLAKEGGAFPKLSMGRPLGIIPHIGNGRQYMSWIHIDDLVSIFQHLIAQKPPSGAYNCVAPNPESNQEVSKRIAATGLFKISPSLPGFIMKLVMGERSIAVLNSTRVSSEKILGTGYGYDYTDIDSAIKSLI